VQRANRVAAAVRAELAAEPLAARGAIVHDWFQGFHGAERVVDAIRADVFAPDAPPDVYTFHAAREVLPPALAAAIVKDSRLASLPGIRQRHHDPGRWRYLLPYMPYYFRRLDLSAYDIVISSSHACAVHVRPRPDALHVCYCHTPMRYAWLPETDSERAVGLRELLLRAFAPHLRRLDYEASRHPDAYVANSEAVRQRIQRFYGRDAVVIHPPVDVTELTPLAEKEPGRFLWVHRLVSYKRPELVIEAFRDLPYRLTMVGVGPLEERLRATLPPNVELTAWLPRERLVELYQKAVGFIHIAEEDFGISMVEALAAGTPVIALDRGGARDIIRPGKDGLLLDEPDVASIRAAVARLADREWDRGVLAGRAQIFSREMFVNRLRDYLSSLADTPVRRVTR